MEIEWGSKGGQGSLHLDTGAKPAALVTGNVGREATEMSPVSGLDPGRTRWVNLLGGPTGWTHWVECQREGGLWDPTRSRGGGVCESPVDLSPSHSIQTY